ncbi:ammonium transporter AmtB-like domain-containing protein [Copromyces sp. CBS 386.78]|nr:ammonium transporter AmtB-like domain-containing protein [Copromyces sp. CBS 386.78]
MANSTSTSISTTRTAIATSSAAAHSSTSTSSPSKHDPETGYHDGDIAFLLLCTVLVMLMIPGVGFFYSGLSRRKSALSLIFISILACAVTSIQWFIWGFSLSFSPGVASSGLIGTLNNAFFMGVLDQPFVNNAHPIPDLLFAVYQGLFSAIAVVLAAGAAAERGRLLPCAVFMFVWATLVYDPVACWTWNPHGKGGWAYAMGILDWAGGTPVHIVGGCASLAYSMVLGKRKGHGTHELNYRPHNVASVIIGTIFLWVGWFGFNAGGALAANLRAVVAVATTNLAACVGGITWCVLDWRFERKWSAVGFCSGVVAGLIAITPGSGFVPVWAAVPFGIFGAGLANYGTKIKFLCNIDDALDTFAVHAVAGLVGNILTGVFASKAIAHLDGATNIDGGWLNHNWKQVLFQIAGSVAGGVYSFIMTALIVVVLDLIPGLSLRVSEAAEVLGIDDSEIGEFAYDYVELTREVGIDGGVAGSIMDGVGETGSMFSNAQLRQQQQQVGRSASPTIASAAGARAFTREDTKDSAIVFGSGQPAIYG